MNGISQISFSAEETVSPKKPTSVPEVAKQRELSGSLQSESDLKTKKQISDAKFKEISGHDIFSPAPEIQPRSILKFWEMLHFWSCSVMFVHINNDRL